MILFYIICGKSLSYFEISHKSSITLLTQQNRNIDSDIINKKKFVKVI